MRLRVGVFVLLFQFAFAQSFESAREFVAGHVKPRAQEIDKTGEFPLETIKMLGEMGFLGIPFPEDIGGMGMDNLANANGPLRVPLSDQLDVASETAGGWIGRSPSAGGCYNSPRTPERSG